jgi:inositol-phosphate transport system substrate-binding protein
MKHIRFLVILLLLISAAAFAANLPKEMTFTVWSAASPLDHWRAENVRDAAKAVQDAYKAKGIDTTILVTAVSDPASWPDYKRKFALAAEDNQAPYIIVSGHEDVAPWAQAGYIVPLADSIKAIQGLYPEFADVIDNLWNCTTWHGKVWAVPQDTEARPMFFSKTKLKALGWSDAKIAGLPDQIKSGAFTLDDMIATCKEAIAKGVIPAGNGYWHRPLKGGDFLQYYASYGGRMYDQAADKLVISQKALEQWYDFQRRCVTSGTTPDKYIGTTWNVWHDTVANDKVLFWNAGTWMWNDWVKNWAKGGEAEMFKNIGYALEPSGIRGKPGGTLSHPLVYMVTSEKASKNKYKDLIIEVLAKVCTKELNTRHAIESTHLGVLKSMQKFEPYLQAKFLASCTYMLDNNYFQPNHAMYTPWFDIVYDGMVAAEQGEKTPAVAAKEAVAKLKLELGDALIVE